jgi:hypothetical protein
MTRDYIESACVSHYHVIATIEIRKRPVELVDAYSRDPVGGTRGHFQQYFSLTPRASLDEDARRSGDSVKVAACGKDNSVVTHHKATVQLRQFFNSSAEIEVGDVA